MIPKQLSILRSEFFESITMALRALAAHKLRSALTLLGILVGVFSIIVVMTAVRVLQSNVESLLSQLGSQTFLIQKHPVVFFNRPEGWEKIRRRRNITLQQCARLQEKLTLASTVGVEEDFWAGEIETAYKKTSPDVPLMGETPGSFPARNWTVQDGRILLDSDVDSARDVCILGGSLATNLFPLGAAVGERLKIDGINYTVIGVLEASGASLGGNQDNFAVIPITTGLHRYGASWRSLGILIQARDQANYESCMEEARGAFRLIRQVPPGEPDDFEIMSNDSLITQFNSLTFAVRVGVAVISSIALIAAGIGIMNIMLVSVTERTREIGIRRAIGAKRRNIMTQFILEAVVLCEIGGVLGVVLGILGGNLTALLMKFPAVIPVDWIIIGLTICSIVGVVFGTYPAWKAAHLDPIDSLRYE